MIASKNFILNYLPTFKQWGVIGLYRESFKKTRYFKYKAEAKDYFRKVTEKEVPEESIEEERFFSIKRYSISCRWNKLK